MIVYISIGNSDDRLTQRQWAGAIHSIGGVLQVWSDKIHGFWLTPTDSPYQGACWCIDILLDKCDGLKSQLRHEAYAWKQDSIAWAPAITQFLGSVTDPSPEQSTGWAGSEHR